MCETRVNIDGRYDRNRGQLSNFAMTPQNFNKVNEVYSQPNNFFTYRYVNTSKLNLNKFNNNVPEEIFEYYEEVFLNSNLDYLNNYLVKKRQEAVSNQNTNVRRKTLATDIGRAFVNDDNAYVKVLFLPTLITFTYLLSLFLYCFVFK